MKIIVINMTKTKNEILAKFQISFYTLFKFCMADLP